MHSSTRSRPWAHASPLAPCPHLQCLLIIALAVSRALNIFPICMAVNLFRSRGHKISKRHMVLQWWAGLRGPMAYALALDASEKYGERGLVMKTAVWWVWPSGSWGGSSFHPFSFRPSSPRTTPPPWCCRYIIIITAVFNGGVARWVRCVDHEAQAHSCT